VAVPKPGFAETPVSDQLPTLAEAGIDKNLAKKARAAAAMSHEEFETHKRAEGEAVRTRTRSRTKSPTVKARALAQRRERKRSTDLDKWLSQISAACIAYHGDRRIVHHGKFGLTMSALGRKRTSGDIRSMSALPPKAHWLSAFRGNSAKIDDGTDC
jgi:hypothetical protein